MNTAADFENVRMDEQELCRVLSAIDQWRRFKDDGYDRKSEEQKAEATLRIQELRAMLSQFPEHMRRMYCR